MTADDEPAPAPEAPEPAPPAGGGGSWVRPVVLVASCLVIGFVGGWILRGDDGPVTVLAPAAPDDTGDAGTVTTGGTTTGGGPTLSRASLYGTAKVGKVMRVRVTLAASAKVTVEIRTTPVRGRTQLIKRFRSRIAFPKGASIFRLSAPTRAATRLIVVKAGGQTKSFRVTIRR